MSYRDVEISEGPCPRRCRELGRVHVYTMSRKLTEMGLRQKADKMGGKMVHSVSYQRTLVGVDGSGVVVSF